MLFRLWRECCANILPVYQFKVLIFLLVVRIDVIAVMSDKQPFRVSITQVDSHGVNAISFTTAINAFTVITNNCEGANNALILVEVVNHIGVIALTGSDQVFVCAIII